MNYRVIKKGRGYVHEHANQLYKPVKNEGETKYLKCIAISCDGSAKLVVEQLFRGKYTMYLCVRAK